MPEMSVPEMLVHHPDHKSGPTDWHWKVPISTSLLHWALGMRMLCVLCPCLHRSPECNVNLGKALL